MFLYMKWKLDGITNAESQKMLDVILDVFDEPLEAGYNNIRSFNCRRN